MPELFLTVQHEGRDNSPDAVIPLNPGQDVQVVHHDHGFTVTILTQLQAPPPPAPAPAKKPAAKKTTAKKVTTKK